MPFNRLFPISAILLCAALSGCSQNPMAWWKSINHKAEHLASIEVRFEVLEKEHAKLKKDYFKLQSEFDELQARSEGHEKETQSLAQTGSPTGRTLASIEYSVPKGLKPAELKSLAYEHFREERFAEAAVTFEDFLDQPESAVLHDADSMYTAGVAWFKLGNYTKATEHLEAAKASATGDQKEKVRKKVDLWLRVIDSKKGHGDKA
jgi:TolA-binding protein